jgi:hypothetical protein
MSKKIRILLPLLCFELIALGALSGCKGSSPSGQGSAGGPGWVIVDENYVPRDMVEEFIKNDSANRGLLPVSLINYGHDEAVLARFKGSRFAGPKVAVLRMFYPGLEDWEIVDLKYQNQKKQEVLRTVLYVEDGGAWKVADSGSLMK